VVDIGYEPFRFIHWNCQAIPNSVLNIQNGQPTKGDLNVVQKK